MDKLKEILFDEEMVEIPVITKEETEDNNTPIKTVKEEDEIIVHKIESTRDEEELFDMPKLKEEAREEVRTSTFTFPVFDDEDLDLKDVTRSSKNKEEKIEIREEVSHKKSSTKTYDLLSSSDYKIKKELKENSRPTPRLDSVMDSKKPFTLSPIISPVYGILNENYKKEDIVTRGESMNRLNTEKIDLDSVRRKAYGTLEDEIEASLTKSSAKDILDEVPSKEELTLEDLSDDGLMITDLLVDREKNVEPEFIEEIFDIDSDLDINREIDIDAKEEKSVKKEAIGEEDLFDLIDSLYARKDED